MIPSNRNGSQQQRIRAVVRQRPVIKADNELARMLRMSPEVCVHVNGDGQRVSILYYVILYFTTLYYITIYYVTTLYYRLL
jgi:hypothetical protein